MPEHKHVYGLFKWMQSIWVTEVTVKIDWSNVIYSHGDSTLGLPVPSDEDIQAEEFNNM